MSAASSVLDQSTSCYCDCQCLLTLSLLLWKVTVSWLSDLERRLFLTHEHLSLSATTYDMGPHTVTHCSSYSCRFGCAHTHTFSISAEHPLTCTQSLTGSLPHMYLRHCLKSSLCCSDGSWWCRELIAGPSCHHSTHTCCLLCTSAMASSSCRSTIASQN